MGREAVLRSGGVFRRDCARPCRRADRRAVHRLRGLYEPSAAAFSAIVAAARERWPELGRAVVWHRIGHIELGEASVVVVVSTPHREEAFDACRYLIDTLKATAPIWKHETWEGGTDWSLATRPVEAAPEVNNPGGQ